MASLSVLIADDHALVREGLRAVLAGHPSLCVVGEAVDGIDACVKSAALGPAIVIMDLSMPKMNGADATRRVLRSRPETRVVVLSAYEELPYVRELLDAGARGYVLKRTVVTSLLRALDVVAAGGIFLDPALAQRPAAPLPYVEVHRQDLSAREAEIASLTARGHANAEIGAMLKISVKTVETHKTHLMSKLGLKTRAQLVRYAIFRGWLTV